MGETMNTEYRVVWNGCRDHVGGPYLFARVGSDVKNDEQDHARVKRICVSVAGADRDVDRGK